MGDLNRRGRAADQHDLVASSRTGRPHRGEDERHEGGGGDGRARALPALGVAAHGVVAALIPEPAQASKIRIRVSRSRGGLPAFAVSIRSRWSRQGPSLGKAAPRARRRNAVAPERMTLRTVLRETCRSRTMSLIARPAGEEPRRMRANRVHALHPPPPVRSSRRAVCKSKLQGSELDADPPPQGVKVARRNTPSLPPRHA